MFWSLDLSLIMGLSFGIDVEDVSVERLSPPSPVEAEPGVGESPGGATMGCVSTGTGVVG